MIDSFARHWHLQEGLDFLNHGSFGACPKPVLEAQHELRLELERQPVDFFVRRLPDRLDEAREKIGAFVNADPDDLAAVNNATSGVNAVLRSLSFSPGDELLATDHTYNACKNALDFVAGRSGARVVVVRLPFPVANPGEIADLVLSAATGKTRLALLDHVTSATGLVLPIETMVSRLAERGIDTLVDGAHAPGMIELDVGKVGAAYYVGHCHKWLCAPKGAAFLHVRRDRREAIHPLVISHGANTPRAGRTRFHDEFDWTGTDDPTPFLCVPLAIEFLGSLVPGGWPELRSRNRALALTARAILCDALSIDPPTPDEMIGMLAAMPLPDGSGAPPTSPLYTDPLQDVLREKHKIEVPVVPWPAPPRRLIRISAQLYNHEEQYRRLAAALRKEV